MPTVGQMKDMYKQFEELVNKCDSLSREIRTIKEELKEKDKEIVKLKTENGKLRAEILRLKNKNKKDSSNSSKPSSTDGYKKVITNRREKSDKKVGGQVGHKGSGLSIEEVEKIKASSNCRIEKYEINKNEENKDKEPVIRTVIDIEVVNVIREYWYYPDEKGKYNIAKEHIKNVQYGNNIKAFAMDMMYEVYNSTDGVGNFISSITNNSIKVSKGTLVNWSKELNKKIAKELESIESNLVKSYYLNCDDSQIKVDGENYNNICSCNDKYSRFWISKKKDKKTLEEIGFLKNFYGIIVKDGTDVYNGYGTGLAQCVSHIQRYIKEIIDGNKHEGAKKMKEFLTKANDTRNVLIAKNKKSFTKKQYNELMKEYEEILQLWKEEWMHSSKLNNLVYEEERKLLTRLEESDREQILYFLKDFNIPATNNQAETDQRNIKIKQKIGKFRSELGAKIYANIRSCINTYKKNDINILYAFRQAFSNNLVIV